MVVVAISMSSDFFSKIEERGKKFHDDKAVIFKRSAFYRKLLEVGLQNLSPSYITEVDEVTAQTLELIKADPELLIAQITLHQNQPKTTDVKKA